MRRSYVRAVRLSCWSGCAAVICGEKKLHEKPILHTFKWNGGFRIEFPFCCPVRHPIIIHHYSPLSFSYGYFLSSSLNQSPLHPPSASSTTPSSSTPPQRTSRDGGRDRTYRAERERDKERERLREETRPHSVVDLTQEGRSEDDRKASRDRDQDKDKDHDSDRDRDGWSFHPHQQKSHSHPSTVESRSRLSPPQPSFPPGGGGGEGRFVGSEKDRRGREDEGGSRSNHSQNSNSNNSNSHSERQRRNESVATSAGTLHISYVLPPPLQQSSAGLPNLATPRDPVREQRVSAPTYVPSVEVYDERVGPIQIASQARDNKHRDRERDRDREPERDRERESYRFHEKSLVEHPRLSQSSEMSNQREEGSVICSNGSLGKRSQDASFSSSQSRFSPETRDLSKHSLRVGVDRIGAESKWNAMSPSANYATNHMAALAAQHGHNHSTSQSQPSQTQKSSSPHTSHQPNSSQSSHSHSPQTHGHGRAAEEGSQRRYLDQSGLYHPAASLVGASSGGEHPDSAEVSAMQSLIKYSGNFAAEGPASSRHIIDGRGPFGGLGNLRMGPERERDRGRDRDKERVAGAMRVPPQLKREQERPDSARSFGREGEGEVRHPPVGIAVAVARQRDSGSTSKQTSGSSDTQRPLLQTAVKGNVKDLLSFNQFDGAALISLCCCCTLVTLSVLWQAKLRPNHFCCLHLWQTLILL
ncbi:hypothetical protein XENOCAPTIV_028649 [Xenoophorus captivus]|uniref:Uncharacterized protein n=1 Tax=Xenoophorus captivus TaxID=1517983 RepID=A0ABV0QKU7_9TELE